MSDRITETNYDNAEWNSMSISGRWSTWNISGCSDGDVEIECESRDGAEHLILNQSELRQVIEFLQSKLR